MEQVLGRLGFLSFAREAFRPVERFGFREVESDALSLRYQSENLALFVGHGRLDYELYVWLERKADLPITYSLGEMLSVVAPRLAREVYCQTTRAEILREYLQKSARALITECRPFLLNDQTLFETVRGEQPPLHPARHAPRDNRARG